MDNDRSPGISAYNAQDVEGDWQMLPLPSAAETLPISTDQIRFRAFLLPTKDVAGNLEKSIYRQDESSDN